MKPGKKNQPTNRYRRLLPAMLAILIAGIWGCGAQNTGDQGTQSADSQSCIPVDTAEVKNRDLEEIIRSIGTIEAFQTVTVKPETEGTIETVHFKEGQKVKKGDLLYTINDAKIQADLRARQAALEEAEANQENARLIFERRQRLYQENLGTEEARDEARTRHQALTAQIKRLNAEIENIKELLDDTRISAPFDGIAGEQNVDSGQLVGTDTALTSVVQIDRLKLSFTVPERYMGRVAHDQQIRGSVAAYPEKNFTGTVYFIDPQIVSSTRSIKIKAQMDNPDNMLQPGGFATIELITGVRENVPVVPEEALIPTRDGYMIFQVLDSKARAQDVETGLRQPGIVEITEGLQGGETIVQAGHISLDEGDKICSE